MTSMAIDPVIPYQLAVASSDGIVRLYDRRMLKAQNSHGGLRPKKCSLKSNGNESKDQNILPLVSISVVKNNSLKTLPFRPGCFQTIAKFGNIPANGV